MADVTHALKACPCCGLVQAVPEVGVGEVAACPRCRSVVWNPAGAGGRNRRAFAAALAALFLYFPGIALPVMRIEQLGQRIDASIWSGSIGLVRAGEVLVGSVVFVCSVVVPLLKLGSLLVLTGLAHRVTAERRAWTYRWVELAGRWGMLDVLLIAITVAWIKFGGMMEISPGPGAIAFTACVVLSLFASSWFDPQPLWEAPRFAARPARRPRRSR